LTRAEWAARKGVLLRAHIEPPTQLCNSNTKELMIVDKPVLTSLNLPAPVACMRGGADLPLKLTGSGDTGELILL
jgi:hypothetical protein